MSETTNQPHDFTPGDVNPRWCGICGASQDAYLHASEAERQAFDSQRAPAPGPVPASSAGSRKRRNLILAAVAGFALVVALGVGLAIGLSGGKAAPKGGFYNMTTLESSVQGQIATNSNYPLGATVLSCSMVSGNTATCVIGELDNPNDQGITVLISADGSTWTQQ